MKSILLFLLFPILCYSQVTKNTSQVFHLKDVASIYIIDAPNIQFKKTKGSRIIIEGKISTSLSSESLLDFIISKGRYDFRSETNLETREMTLELPKKRDPIFVKGEILKEDVIFTIYIPESIPLVQAKKIAH